MAGAGGHLHAHRTHRSAPHHRHRGPDGRPPRGLRRGVRRLGGAARGGGPRHGAGAHRHRRAAGAAHGRRRPDPADRRRGPGAAARGRAGAGRAVPDRRRRAEIGGRRRRDVHRHPQHQLHQRLLHRLPLLRLRAAPHRRRRLHPLPGAGGRPRPAGVGRRRGRGVHAGRHPPRPARHGVLRHREGGQGARPRHACARLLPDGGGERRHPHRHVHPRVADGREGGGPRHHPRHGGGDPGRRGPLGPHQGQAADGHLDRGRQDRPRTGHPLLLHDDVRPCRPAPALARPSAHPGRHPAGDRRLHRVRHPALHPHQRAGLPGRHRPPRPDHPRQPGGHGHGPPAAAPLDPQHPDKLGQTGHGGGGGDAPLRRQRPGRHPHGGDDLADGGLVVRLVQVGPRPGGRGRGGRPSGEAPRHALRRGARGAPARGGGLRRPPPGTPPGARLSCRCSAGGGLSTMIRPPVRVGDP
ncbi:hypothetical protein SGPA1_50788 [Streptomyces misionensis JCM 4497]